MHVMCATGLYVMNADPPSQTQSLMKLKIQGSIQPTKTLQHTERNILQPNAILELSYSSQSADLVMPFNCVPPRRRFFCHLVMLTMLR